MPLDEIFFRVEWAKAQREREREAIKDASKKR